jgi:hypothetical protein
MKRSFVYLVLALALSLLLCACGNMTERGIVTASPWPDVTDPVLPTPDPAVMASPIPELDGNDTSGADSNVGTGVPDMSTNSPSPTDTTR